MALMLLAVAILSFAITASANTECVWATGRVLCNRNQTKVVGAVVELYDLDSPQNSNIKNPIDPDDKVGFSLVEDKTGLWTVEGCASDQDWLPGLTNKPEIYIRVFHYCNSDAGEFKTIMPTFKVFTPKTYDYHIENPIILDD
ncbi:Protein TTR-53 [Aphelenchoides avenae]|nr:Protein TTR-53 [Aphelenchus avenae]